MIIGIAGEKNSGKDTVAKMINDYNYLFTNVKFATKLKKIVSIFTSIPEERFEDRDFKENYYWNPGTGRTKHISDIPKKDIIIKEISNKYPENCWISFRLLLQDVGTDMFVKKFPKVWINSALGYYSSLLDMWVVSDVRTQNEVDEIIRLGGIIIKINRNITSENNDSHITETSVRTLKNIDFEIDNNSTKSDLRELVYRVLEDNKIGKLTRTVR